MVVQRAATSTPAARTHAPSPYCEVKVSYTEREDRDPPYSDVVKLEVSLNEIVCDAEYAPLGEANLHVSSLNDIVAEKLRALLQQVERGRSRSGEGYICVRGPETGADARPPSRRRLGSRGAAPRASPRFGSETAARPSG